MLFEALLYYRKIPTSMQSYKKIPPGQRIVQLWREIHFTITVREMYGKLICFTMITPNWRLFPLKPYATYVFSRYPFFNDSKLAQI
jgi:hypothetical protein